MRPELNMFFEIKRQIVSLLKRHFGEEVNVDEVTWEDLIQKLEENIIALKTQQIVQKIHDDLKTLAGTERQRMINELELLNDRLKYSIESLEDSQKSVDSLMDELNKKGED